MKTRLRAVWLLLGVASAVNASGDVQLTGPDVVSFEHLRVDFVSSIRFVRQGVRSGDGCRYERKPLSTRDGELPPDHALAEVVRAQDTVNCRELVERGVIRQAARALPDSSAAPPRR